MILRIMVTVPLMLLLAGCAGTDEQGEFSYTNKPRKCKFDETFSCVERMGEPVRCFCADKDTLRELLEPTIE